VKEGGDQAERLAKVLAAVGYGSRRVCDELIGDGRVTVDGEVAIVGCRVDTSASRVEVDGVPVPMKPGLVHYLLHKPARVVTTAHDPQGRATVLELVPSQPRVFPVGRLDFETEGLIIVTNDGELTQRLTHPSFGVDKEYLVELERPVTAGELRQLRHGVMLDDGPSAPARAAAVAPRGLRLTIHEGRNRQVRRMCEAVGHRVVRLVRIRIGPIVDHRLIAGQWRLLTTDEVRNLHEAALAGRESGQSENQGR